jgi:aminopeptidase N
MMKRSLLTILILTLFAPLARAQRLAGDVIPEHYALWFAPDLKAATFRGRETIDVQLKVPTTRITLHAAEITFDTVTVTANGSRQQGRVTLDPSSEMATLTVPQRLPPGPAVIHITYTGMLNDKLRGFYMSEANGRRYAITQMEATDARRAFPSFDEPAYKATFDISLMIDQGDTAISNGAQVADAPGPDAGKHTLTFARTLKMSTYLVAMIVGDFVCREGSADAVPIRICSTPDKRALTGFALEAAQQQLSFYNEYFGIKYPFGKLDIIAVPDFAAGAMENTGAIAFRERLLLADPDRASLGVRKSIALALAHEIAHMWFGDLVTMKWWDDIWLNEGFATWMEKKPLARWRPEWHTELDEVEDTQGAAALDALKSTRAIRTEVTTPEEINEVFDPIAYEKSASVLRMVETFVGNEAFRTAVASYLRKYSFKNAAAEDFWTEVTRLTGKPVDRIMKSYVDQAGIPVLDVGPRCAKGDTQVALHQERFMGVPGAKPSQTQTWTIPVCARATHAPSAAPRCAIVDRSRQELSLQVRCTNSVLANNESHGYYFSDYSPESIAALARNRVNLTAAERLGLLGDEWWMVRAGRHDIGVFLDLASALADDDTPAVVEQVRSRLQYIGEYVVASSERARYQEWVRKRFMPALDALGFPGDPRDPDDIQSRRAALLSLVGVTGDSPEIQRRARELAGGYITDPRSLSGTLAPTVLQLAALGGDAELYDRYLAQLKQLSAQPEEYYRFFNALTWFRDPSLIKRTLELAVSPAVRTQDTNVLIGGLLSQPWSRSAAWEFTQSQWQKLTAMLGTFQGIPGIVSSLSAFCTSTDAENVRRFFASHSLASVERTLQQSLERIETCAAVKARQSPSLMSWLMATSQ